MVLGGVVHALRKRSLLLRDRWVGVLANGWKRRWCRVYDACEPCLAQCMHACMYAERSCMHACVHACVHECMHERSCMHASKSVVHRLIRALCSRGPELRPGSRSSRVDRG